MSHPRGESAARGKPESLRTSQETPKYLNSGRKMEETDKHQRGCCKDRPADWSDVRAEKSPLDSATWRSPDKRNFTGRVWQEPCCRLKSTGEVVGQSWNTSASNVMNAFKSKAPKGEPNVRGNKSHDNVKV